MANILARFQDFRNKSSAPGKNDNETKFFLSFPTMPVGLSNGLIQAFSNIDLKKERELSVYSESRHRNLNGEAHI